MKITKQHIENLLHLMTFGLIHGSGDEYEADKRFCVQQAVHKVITNNLEKYENDGPTECVNEYINGFGIRLNDAGGWMNEKSRAEGLKRFAIAEMGTAEMEGFSVRDFYTKLSEKLFLNEEHESEHIVDQYLRMVAGNGESLNTRLTHVANMAADVLKEMGTPGSEFLYLVDEPDRAKREEEAFKLANTKHQTYAAHMANFGFGACSVKPKQQQ